MNERLREFLASKSDRLGGASAGVAVCNASESVRAAWLSASDSSRSQGGVADNGSEPAFLAYSVTKTVIATLVLMHVEEGELSLQDPLSLWFPDVEGSEQITLRNLLDHTSGLRDYGAEASYHEAVREHPTRPWSFQRFREETIDRGLLFAPGKGWAYSNPGYMLLRRILEEAGGARLGALARKRICRPLGLVRTREVREIGDLAALAPALSLLTTSGDEPVDVREVYHPAWVSHGLIASTPSELARFLAGLFAGRLLQPASLDVMTELVPVPSAARKRPAGNVSDRYGWVEPGYGLGLMGDPAARWGPVFGHNGGGPGYSASAFHAPSHGVTAVAMVGAEGAVAEQLVFDLLDELVWPLAPFKE